MFEFQRLRRAADIREAPMLAASIFDILKVFLRMLSLFGRRDSRGDPG
jgi:hypothetical protein